MRKKVVALMILILTTSTRVFASAPPNFTSPNDGITSPWGIWTRYGAPNMNMFLNYFIAGMTIVSFFKFLTFVRKYNAADEDDRQEIKLLDKWGKRIGLTWLISVFIKVILVWGMGLFGVDLGFVFG